MTSNDALRIRCIGLTLGYGTKVVQRDVTFSIKTGSIFAIVGGCGCGKSTVLRSMIGLLRPIEGSIMVDGENLWTATPDRRMEITRRFGILFQSGALWSSLTVGENVALPLQMFAQLPVADVVSLVRLKLSLVGMASSEFKKPSELSGGMRKRAGLARALVLDPDILFFDEPSAGLDPIASRRLDELILELRAGLGATIIIVSHELPSLFGICDDGIFLDGGLKTAIAHGAPRDLRDRCMLSEVQAFMRRELRSTSPSTPADSRGEH